MIFKNLMNKFSAKSGVDKPHQHNQCHSIGVSDVGKKRQLNEDSFLIDEDLGLYVVADGMGGHRSGEVASRLAIDVLFNYLQAHLANNQSDGKNFIITADTLKQALGKAVEDSNHQVNQCNIKQQTAEGQGMGTTLTGFINTAPNKKKELQIYAFNVGDSRCYSFYQSRLTQLSTDHSHYQLWKETGHKAEEPTKNIIYKAIGPWKKVVADQYTHTVREDELILLCSDGLTDMLADDEICAILNKNKNNHLKETAQALIAMANRAGGRDNVTVLLFQPFPS